MTRRTKFDFAVTFTDPDTLPLEGLSRATRDVLLREGRDLALYHHPQGHRGLRALVADRLKGFRGIDVGPDRIFLSSGALGAVAAIFDVLLDPGDAVLVESFSYLGTLNLLLDRGAHVVHVPTDREGMDTGALERELEALGRRAKLIYTISAYQNPLGMTLSAPRRRRLIALSRAYGVPILENEVYADLRYDGELPPAMYGLDGEDGVFYVGSFSKLVGCAVRLGYGVTPPALMEKLRLVRFGGEPSHLASMIVHEYLKEHLDAHLADILASLQRKRDAMLSSLGEHFPKSCTFSRPDGGMHVWVQLPPHADTVAVYPKAFEAGVRYRPGTLFHALEAGRDCLRLCFSYNTPPEIEEGVALLARVFGAEGLFG